MEEQLEERWKNKNEKIIAESNDYFEQSDWYYKSNVEKLEDCYLNCNSVSSMKWKADFDSRH